MNTSKTLLSILVEELPGVGGWPEGVTAITQDSNMAINSYKTADGLEANQYGTWRCSNVWIDYCITAKKAPCLASDYATAIITRDQYESALIDRPEYFADAEGWTPWCGGECPVGHMQAVEVRYRDGTIKPVAPAFHYIWTNGYGDCKTTDADIVAYRLHQPQDANSRANDDRFGCHIHSGVNGHHTGTPEEADLNECIGQPQEDLDQLTRLLVEDINYSFTEITLANAYKIAANLIDAGYRKQ